VSEVPLHGIFLFLCLPLDSIELDSLPLNVGETCVLCAQCVDIGNDTCISKMEEGVVDDEAVV
jgi:hypothetical protein